MMTDRPIRVLHVLGALNQGGVETWLLNVLNHINRSRFQVDFLVHTAKPAVYDDDVRRLGSSIFSNPYPHRPWRYAREFKRILRHRDGGTYDIVHSHVHDYSGFVLRLASRIGVPVRIAHSHLDSSIIDRKSGVVRRQYLGLMKRWIRRYATAGLGCSRSAADALFGCEWQHEPRWKLFYCGIDLKPFVQPSERQRVRGQLGISADEHMIGHVGRFNQVKNHCWMVEFLGELIRRGRKSRLLLVGDGPLRPAVEQQFRTAGLADHVVFTGPRRDVPRLLSAMDAFLLPSLFEGLPIALLEAQAAGLPCLVSDAIDPDATVIDSLVRRLSLSQPVRDWVQALEHLRDVTTTESRERSAAIVSQSPFNIDVCVENLECLYLDQINLQNRNDRHRELVLTD